MLHVAILGLGEAGGTFARDLMATGVRVSGWDPVPDRRPAGIVAAEDNPAAAEGADVILAMNLATVALEVAAGSGATTFERHLAPLVDEEMIDRFEAGSRTHARRRIHEMDAVAELLRSIDVEPHLSRAARRSLSDLQAAAGEE